MTRLLAVPASFLNVRHIALGLAVIVGGAMLPVSHARADACLDLWVERNQIYKNAGYCFQTARARHDFGNAGCVTNSDRAARANMGGGGRARVDEIVRMEAQYGCPR